MDQAGYWGLKDAAGRYELARFALSDRPTRRHRPVRVRLAIGRD